MVRLFVSLRRHHRPSPRLDWAGDAGECSVLRGVNGQTMDDVVLKEAAEARPGESLRDHLNGWRDRPRLRMKKMPNALSKTVTRTPTDAPTAAPTFAVGFVAFVARDVAVPPRPTVMVDEGIVPTAVLPRDASIELVVLISSV